MGIVLILSGSLLLASSLGGITGFAFVDEVYVNVWSVLGFVFVIGGAIVLSYTSMDEYAAHESYARGALQRYLGSKYEQLRADVREKFESALRRRLRRRGVEEKVNDSEKTEPTYSGSHVDHKVLRTSKFERAIEGYDPKPIERTIDKLRAGAGGRVERLRHQSGFSARVSKGSRIFYDIDKGKIILTGFTPDHRYLKRQ